MKDHAEYWKESLEGSYVTGWPDLCSAARGCLLSAKVQTEENCAKFEKLRTTRPKGAVFYFLGRDYYLATFGPLVSTVILSSFAIESFLSLVTVISLRISHDDKQAEIDTALNTWSRKKISARLEETIEMTKLKDFSPQLQKEINDLYEYRNRCAHDVPRLHGRPGEWLFFIMKTGKMENTPYGEGWRQLGESVFPLGFGHALSAVKTHDNLVESFKGILPMVEEYLPEGGLREGGFVKTTGILGIFDQEGIRRLECIATEWEQVDSWLKQVTQEDQEAFAHLVAKLRRQAEREKPEA